jgi:pimeloyl-ACP methyl ester carboxylesterase
MRPIKGATLEALERTGHALHTERPKEVAEKIGAFIARHH